MSASNDQTRTIRFKIKRQDTHDSAPYWQEFDVPYRPNANVISCLQWIAENPVTVTGQKTTPVVWDCNCLEEVCGACTMVINGRVAQSCSALIDKLLEQGTTVRLEPMSKFPVVRDLYVDRQRMFANLALIKGWVPIDGTHNAGFGPRESQDDQDMRYAESRCMTCGCCLEACPQFLADNDFVGAQIFAQVDYFNRHETGKTLADDRLETMEMSGGINDCGNAQNCIKVCPKEVPLREAIAAVGRQTTFHAIRTFFRGKK
ncbi:MAG: succinate dehydrogenase iron-sulfur subunit [Phycisphaeraceae bacterium]